MTDNLKLWNAVEQTHPKYVKSFKRGGGFSGTAINPAYLVKVATQHWGPMGDHWGVTVLDEKYVPGAPLVDKDKKIIPGAFEQIHVVRIQLWHPGQDGVRATVESFGQTTFVGMNKYGPFTDEEAPKKSLTDATTKALSMLGFSADIFLGMWDDSKYVNDRKEAVKRDAAKQQQSGSDTTVKTPEETVQEAVQTIDAEVKDRWQIWEKNMGEMVAGISSDEDLMTLKENVRKEFEECPDKETRKRVAMIFANKGAEIAERADA